jgi:hypothetical protein
MKRYPRPKEPQMAKDIYEANGVDLSSLRLISIPFTQSIWLTSLLLAVGKRSIMMSITLSLTY